jgi:hypothetical protein
MNGLGSLVLREDGAVVWEMEVDTKDDSDPHRPVIVHFRGHSLEAANGSGIAGRELF